MFDKYRLKKFLEKYKQDFTSKHWQEEKYKWEAVKCFQDSWNVNAEDFAEMLSRCLSKTGNLLASTNNFPEKMITGFAKTSPEEVRAMFIDLFDESREVYERMEAFKTRAAVLLERYGNGAGQHYQHENAVSAYLWLRYPNKYYIYKFSEVKAVASELESNYQFKKGAYADNIRNCFKLYDEIRNELKQDAELINLFRGQLTDTCYPDPELNTLTFDIAFYISRYNSQEQAAQQDLPVREPIQQNILPFRAGEEGRGYWWLNANPKVWRFSELAAGEEVSYTLYNDDGNKRRVFQNFLDARAGDWVIGYEVNPVKQVVAIAQICTEQDGEEIVIKKIEGLDSPIDYQTLRDCPELENMEYFRNPRGSLFKLTKAEFDCIMDLIREDNPLEPETAFEPYTRENFLEEVYMTGERYDRLAALLRNKKNIILQGAPGVGKTFAAKRLAYSIMGEQDENRVELVQFHQNYSYEDFVMGYKPAGEGFELKYGIFYRFCHKASNQPGKDFFFIIDEINRGNMSRIFGELLMLIECGYRGTEVSLAYNGLPFSVPENVYIIGMMNTADRSLAMIDYALRRRFSFFEMEPGFDAAGFLQYQNGLDNETLNELIARVKALNKEIALDPSLGKGFCIGHSYFCGCIQCTEEWLRSIVDYDILPTLEEYWFDDMNRLQRWENSLRGVFQ